MPKTKDEFDLTGVGEVFEQEFIPRDAPKVYIVAQNAPDAMRAQETMERKGGIRLTQTMRDTIIEKALKHKFDKQAKQLQRDEYRYSHRAMVAAFGHAALAALEKIGPPYAYVDYDTYGQPNKPDKDGVTEGMLVNWRVGDTGETHALHSHDPLPMMSCNSRHASKFIIKEGELAANVRKWAEEKETMRVERGRLLHKLGAMLNTVTTFNSLVKTWPAGKKFYEHIPKDFPFRNQVPAVMVNDINNDLGI